MMRRKALDDGGNNKSWEMFQELMPYRGCPLPLIFTESHILQTPEHLCFYSMVSEVTYIWFGDGFYLFG